MTVRRQIDKQIGSVKRHELRLDLICSKKMLIWSHFSHFPRVERDREGEPHEAECALVNLK